MMTYEEALKYALMGEAVFIVGSGFFSRSRKRS